MYYGTGSPKEYADSVVSLRPGLEISRDKLLNDLVDIQLSAMTSTFNGKFRDTVGMWIEIFPASRDIPFRVEFSEMRLSGFVIEADGSSPW